MAKPEQRPAPCDRLTVSGTGALPSAFPVTELATATERRRFGLRRIASPRGSRGAAGLDRSTPGLALVRLDAASAGLTLPAARRPAGDYETTDGWIRLHTNAPHHRRAVEQVLDPASDKGTLAARVLSWKKSELEQAVIEAGGCAAQVRSAAAWRQHIQGKSVALEP